MKSEEEFPVKMSKFLAHLIGKLMGSINATTEDAIVVGLVLGTEENARKFFLWWRSLEEDPTPQQCFEKATEIAGVMDMEPLKVEE